MDTLFSFWTNGFGKSSVELYYYLSWLRNLQLLVSRKCNIRTYYCVRGNSYFTKCNTLLEYSIDVIVSVKYRSQRNGESNVITHSSRSLRDCISGIYWSSGRTVESPAVEREVLCDFYADMSNYERRWLSVYVPESYIKLLTDCFYEFWTRPRVTLNIQSLIYLLNSYIEASVVSKVMAQSKHQIVQHNITSQILKPTVWQLNQYMQKKKHHKTQNVFMCIYLNGFFVY